MGVLVEFLESNISVMTKKTGTWSLLWLQFSLPIYPFLTAPAALNTYIYFLLLVKSTTSNVDD